MLDLLLLKALSEGNTATMKVKEGNTGAVVFNSFSSKSNRFIIVSRSPTDLLLPLC